jgi:hypothetical protein
MKEQSAVEQIIAEIDNELLILEKLHGSEIMGRKIGLAFAKRVAEQAKEIEKEQIKKERIEAYNNGYANGQNDVYAI